MTRVRVKICGIVRPEDAAVAAEAGADAVGMVLSPVGKTCVSPRDAAEIRRALPPFVAATVLFVDQDASFVREAIDATAPSLLQFHGDEDADFCTQFALPYVKACRVRSRDIIVDTVGAHPGAQGILLDSYTENRPGGSGKTFDWSLVPSQLDKPVVLAGGLDADNVAEAIRAVRPWAVDVSSGVAETGEPRRKNADKIRAFIQSVHHAESS